MFKKKSTIFYLYYSGDDKQGDRREYFPGKKTLKELHDWVEDNRRKIETTLTRNVTIQSFGVITENY